CVWAEILPTTQTATERTLPGESIRENITHKITVRNGSIKNPRNDMYFKYKGQKYEVIHYMPNYRRNDLIEFYCKLIIEGENDYGEN
ncbi:MAG: head-tail adaptor protein, partial [Firmicutes bacterium]|nr:head-tail adaptor protein [Bacillota bacterium]